MTLVESIARRAATAGSLTRVMPIMDALKVVCRTSDNHDLLALHLHKIATPVYLRANTSDFLCLDKVFLHDEYRLPVGCNEAFALDPRFIIDAGANIGMATLHFCTEFPQAQVYAIEPESSNFDVLARNCEGRKNVTLIKAALWNKNVPLKLSNPGADKWAFSVEPSTTSAGIDTVTIPDILARSGAPWIDILKIDIEGAERELFSGNCTDWLPKVRLIIIELHDRFRAGCAHAFYSRIAEYSFAQEIQGENIFIALAAPQLNPSE